MSAGAYCIVNPEMLHAARKTILMGEEIFLNASIPQEGIVVVHPLKVSFKRVRNGCQNIPPALNPGEIHIRSKLKRLG